MRAESSILPDLMGAESSATRVIIGQTDYIVPPIPQFPTQLFPRVRGYEILSVIGSGGMGIVYKARQRDLRRTVAIKMLRGATLADPESRVRFQAEAEAVARLQHPNIIQVFEIGLVDPVVGDPHPSPFLSLEFVEGGSLIRRTERPQTPRYSAEMLEKLARAVHAIHQLGVIHRDLKPANVLLTQDGEPKIADFGLAKHTQPDLDSAGRFMTQAGTVVGTPEYMAPEQALGDSPTPAVDIYALGVILYELLTGRVPFHAASPLETMTLSQRQEPVPPRQLQPGLPRDLETICLKCLEKEPSRRYASAEALADDLRRFLDGRPIEARRLSEVEKLTRWCRRNPWIAASLAGVVATFLIAFALVSRSYWRAEKARDQEAKLRKEADDKNLAERWQRYRANLVASESALQLYNVDRAQRTLEDAPAEYRNWEWRHFQSRLDLAQQVLHTDGVIVTGSRSTRYSDRVIVLGESGFVCLWDLKKCKPIRTFPHAHELHWAGMSSDSKLLAYVTDEGDVRIQDVDTDNVVAVFPGDEQHPKMIRFSADGKKLISASVKDTIRVFDLSYRKLEHIVKLSRSDPHGMVTSPDAKVAIISYGHESNAYMYDLVKGIPIATLPGHVEGIHGCNFNGAGDRVVTIERFPNMTIRFWNGRTGELIAENKGAHRNVMLEVAFSPDGERFAVASMDQTISLWDGRTGKAIATLKGHNGQVSCLDFSPDGKVLVTGSSDRTVRLWDAEKGKPIAVLTGHTATILGVNFLADSSKVASVSGDGTIRMWDPKIGDGNEILRGHTNFVYSVAYHPDGKRVISTGWDGTARIWNVATGREEAVFNHGGPKVIVGAISIHPDGKLLATRVRGLVYLWDIETGAELNRWEAPSHNWVDAKLAFNPKGDLLACGCGNGEVWIWDVESRQRIAKLAGNSVEIRDVAFSRDGRWLVVAGDGRDNKTRVWDVAKQEVVRVLEGHTNTVFCLAFNREGTLLATGSEDGTVRLWDTQKWQEIASLKHGTNVYGLAFTPDDTRLACACADNLIRLWDVSTHESVAELRGHTDYVHSVAFSPEGGRLVSASGDFTVRIWDTVRPQDRTRGR